MTADSHDAATCPAFGGCNDCRSAKFEAASPDVEIEPGGVVRKGVVLGRGKLPARPPAPVPEPAYDATVREWQDANDPVDYVDVHAFNAAVNETLDRAGAISNQRAGEYQDTWALVNQHTPFVDSVLRVDDGENAAEQSPKWKRLLVVAALIDVKVSRTLGPWKDDTGLDLINYIAAFTAWRSDYDNT